MYRVTVDILARGEQFPGRDIVGPANLSDNYQASYLLRIATLPSSMPLRSVECLFEVCYDVRLSPPNGLYLPLLGILAQGGDVHRLEVGYGPG